MATLTSTAIESGASPKAIHAGVNAVRVRYNSGATSFSTSAKTVVMCKIPHGARILDMVALVSAGAQTTATDFGISGNSNTLFGSATVGVCWRPTKGLPYLVSATTTGYEIVNATTTLATDTCSVVIDLTVFYDMGNVDPA